MTANQREVTMSLHLTTVRKLDHHYNRSYLTFSYAIASKGSLLRVMCKKRSFKYVGYQDLERHLWYKNLEDQLIKEFRCWSESKSIYSRSNN